MNERVVCIALRVECHCVQIYVVVEVAYFSAIVPQKCFTVRLMPPLTGTIYFSHSSFSERAQTRTRLTGNGEHLPDLVPLISQPMFNVFTASRFHRAPEVVSHWQSGMQQDDCQHRSVLYHLQSHIELLRTCSLQTRTGRCPRTPCRDSLVRSAGSPKRVSHQDSPTASWSSRTERAHSTHLHGPRRTHACQPRVT